MNQHFAGVDAALDRAGELPVTGSADDIVRRSADGDYSDWYAYSAKGFYAYDWRLWHGPYQRLSSPAAHITIGQLPVELRAVALLAEFPVDFADESEITVEYVEPPEPERCVIKADHFFIRGWLVIPVTDASPGTELDWGVPVSLSRDNFTRAVSSTRRPSASGRSSNWSRPIIRWR